MFKINFKKLGMLLLFTATMFMTVSFSLTSYAVDPDILMINLGKEGVSDEVQKNYPTMEAVKNLPDVGIEQAVGTAIKTVLKIAMYLTMISIVVTAIFYIISLGKEEELTKARNIIVYLVIGMAIISASYAIIAGFSRFNFFSANTNPDTIQSAEQNK